MNENKEQNNQNEDESKKFLQKDDQAIKDQNTSPKDSEAISDAGKKRQDGERYQ